MKKRGGKTYAGLDLDTHQITEDIQQAEADLVIAGASSEQIRAMTLHSLGVFRGYIKGQLSAMISLGLAGDTSESKRAFSTSFMAQHIQQVCSQYQKATEKPA